MEDYNLKSVDQIDIDFLERNMMHSKAARAGSIEVWGDAIGRPGDAIYYLDKIEHLKNTHLTLTFKFKHGEIIITNPDGIYLMEMIIAVKSCEKLVWTMNKPNLKIEYFNTPDKGLTAKVVHGQHTPEVDIKEPCFRLFAW